MHELQIQTILSPLGSIDLVAQSQRLISVDFSDCRARMHRLLAKRLGSVTLKPQAHEFGDRLQTYFDGEIDALNHVNLVLQGTPFQNKVWNALTQVKTGQTMTYGELADQINQPKAAQAVGRANALNPILIFIPCHRIVGRNQQMVGYSGGVNRKQWLIKHEKQNHDEAVPGLSALIASQS